MKISCGSRMSPEETEWRLSLFDFTLESRFTKRCSSENVSNGLHGNNQYFTGSS